MSKCKYRKKCPDYSEVSYTCNKTGGMYYGEGRPSGCFRRMKEKENDSLSNSSSNSLNRKPKKYFLILKMYNNLDYEIGFDKPFYLWLSPIIALILLIVTLITYPINILRFYFDKIRGGRK